jgi:hypothetical protein
LVFSSIKPSSFKNLPDVSPNTPSSALRDGISYESKIAVVPELLPVIVSPDLSGPAKKVPIIVLSFIIFRAAFVAL